MNLNNLTNVFTFKDYVNYSGKLFYLILATQILILIGFELLKFGGK